MSRLGWPYFLVVLLNSGLQLPAVNVSLGRLDSTGPVIWGVMRNVTLGCQSGAKRPRPNPPV